MPSKPEWKLSLPKIQLATTGPIATVLPAGRHVRDGIFG
jgi:hypothetical protein